MIMTNEEIVKLVAVECKKKHQNRSIKQSK